MRVVRKALTFDDVLLVPAHSSVVPRDVSLATRLTRTISLNIPLLGAKEVLRRVGVFKVAYLREPAGQRLDEQDHRELSALMEMMGPPF
jgi:hypothetical protein